MRKVVMIRAEAGLISIPVDKAVYCYTCETVSTSLSRCGLCGSERIIELAPMLKDPWDPGPISPATLAA